MTDRHPARAFNQHPTIPDLLAAARGRWREILTDAGIPADVLEGRRGRPCPRCGGRDRFNPMKDLDDRGAVLCRHCFNKLTDPRPGDGIATLRWWFQCDAAESIRWLRSWLDGSGAIIRHGGPAVVTIDVPAPARNWRPTAEEYRKAAAVRPGIVAETADRLGVSADALTRLGMGCRPDGVTAWPMRDASGDIIGIRLRDATGRKWAERGSRAGLFFDPGMQRRRLERVYIVEGPTDTAALLTVGLDAIGLPSASGCFNELVKLLRRLRPGEVAIVADADEAGRSSAERLAHLLVLLAPVRVIVPAIGKDARAWVNAGATAGDIERAADAAKKQQIALEARA
ncbi:MAG: DNA primase [Pirellulaceae bacterium]|nr:MAG: DNA primase [Pirellulaceae bacterium]